MLLVNNWSLLSNPVNRMLSLFAFSCKTICRIATKYFSREGMKSIIRSNVVDQTYVYQSLLHYLHYGVKFVIIAWGYNQLFFNSVFNCLFIYLFFQIFSNGPSMSSESPQDMHKTFIQEMRQPMLRQGYIPIPVSHENTEPRLQQYPSFSYFHPAVQQNLRTDGRTPSPTPTAHCRPRSPVQAPSEACLSCSPALHGPEVSPLDPFRYGSFCRTLDSLWKDSHSFIDYASEGFSLENFPWCPVFSC